MTRRQRRKLFGLPGIARFTVTEDGSECESCGFYPLDRGDSAFFDDRWEVLTCSERCAQNARASEIRQLEEWERRERLEARRPVTFAGDGWMFDNGEDDPTRQISGPTFDGRPGS